MTMSEQDRANQALRILDILEGAQVNFKVSRGYARWLVSAQLENRTEVLSGDSLADVLAQLAQAVAK
jgi:hypothetical protein